MEAAKAQNWAVEPYEKKIQCDCYSCQEMDSVDCNSLRTLVGVTMDCKSAESSGTTVITCSFELCV
jgi:hypothetical protein